MSHKILQPTTAEVDAAEQAICGCLEENVDGYRRPMVEEMLERAKEARLGEFAVRTHPADLDGNEDPLERDVRRMQAEPANGKPSQVALARMTKAELKVLILSDAMKRGRSWALGGPDCWSKDEMIRYVNHEMAPAEPGRLRAVDTPRDHSIAAEHYTQVAADAQMDRALGEGRL
jgi:hypothetical protein